MQTDMGSSIALGTLLRQRYLIKQVLGQGGFGRTYLAVDQERFDEPCVIKEFVVPYQDDSLIEKAKSLFQREASTLYQIHHPQIPRFWGAFENEQRLFLVQDFVQGQTYRSLLQARKQEGQAFSEAEILNLLNHLLPVLSYLHDRDIVHRDISPENIILQTTKSRELIIPADPSQVKNQGLPVLIDFGAVKEAASHWPIVSTITRVGKVGYAPPEQLQTGNVSPHSDIYALGASCLVLLTGREPQNLLNSHTLAWQWQPYADISEVLAKVLQKMVALHPSDRYQSAREAWADLQPLVEGSISSTVLNPMVVPPIQSVGHDIAPAARDTEKQGMTMIRTQLFMTSTPENGASDTSPKTSVSSDSAPQPRKRGIAPSLAIAASLIITTGIGTHLFRSTAPLQSNQQVGGITARTLAPLSDGQPRKIEFAPGGISGMAQGNLRDQTMQPYQLEAAQGQIMTVTLEGTGVLMNLLRSNGQAIDSSAHQTRNWAGQLPANDTYTIQVTGTGTYSLDVAITPLDRLDHSDTQRVRFPRGKNSTTVNGEIQPKKARRYLLEAGARQLMMVRVLRGDVNFVVTTPNGRRIGGSSTNSRTWKGQLPMDGEYTIELASQKQGKYSIAFEIY